MCGILGVHSSTPTDELNLSILEHRGPDGTDHQVIGTHTLGHTRLAIVDLIEGDQPLSSPDGRYWLICNGEIYNHQAIRDQLSDYDFQTQTDSEVILALYDRYGLDAVRHLDGMFAFALIDTEADTIYMGRDPLGIKPLYYGWHEGAFYFSSEIKAIQYHCATIAEFPPAHYYTHDDGLVQYYDLKQVSDTAFDQRNAQPASLADIRTTLTQAVRKRLMSDVPVGVYLSGGLDSTIVAALVAQELPGVHSFSVGVEGSEDLKNARIAAEAIGTEHHEYVYTQQEILDALPDVIYHLESFDPLLVRSAIPNYFLARLTRQYVTVVLTGEGADELYAGYHYLKKYNHQRLHDELVQLTGTLYNCNLQRCDRMTMAHSIEGRVPFLDTDFIEVSMRVPLEHKIQRETGVEKWALRKAFEDILPANVTWRVKEQFSKGAGSSTMLEDLAEIEISDEQFARERADILREAGRDITSKEMLLYYREFDKLFNPSAKRLVALWQGHDVT
jgi:asparagine synthase (glutamine-hydrolysing)